MRSLRYLPLLTLVACGGPPGECSNPNAYRVLAMVGDSVFERTGARIQCIDWSTDCNSDAGAPGTTPVWPGHNCTCFTYELSAGDFSITFPRSSVGTKIALPEGSLTITKRVDVPTSCAQGDYYSDYSGTFEGTFGGRTYRRGVFYAMETK